MIENAMVKTSVLVAALTLLAAAGLGAKADDTEIQRALKELSQRLGLNELITECEQMDLGVALNGEEKADEIGLTREAILNTAESRLRSAGLLHPRVEWASRLPGRWQAGSVHNLSV